MSWLKKSQPKEKSLQDKVLKFLRSNPKVGFVRKWSDRWSKGIPDVFCIADGYPVFIELKSSRRKKATPIQEAVIDEIILSGGYARVCYSLKDVEEFLDEILA